MEINLTRDAQKMIAIFYKEYLKRRKNGESKEQSKDFMDSEKWKEELFPNCNPRDIDSTFRELARAFGIKSYIRCGFRLNDTAIIYMENRLKNTAKDTISFLAQLN